MDGSADSRDPGSRQAKTSGEIRQRALRVRVQDVGAVICSGERREPSVLCVEWFGPHAGTWVAAALVRALEIFLEVGQVAARARVHGTQPAWFLGAAWVSRRGRPLERDEVLVARTLWTG